MLSALDTLIFFAACFDINGVGEPIHGVFHFLWFVVRMGTRHGPRGVYTLHIIGFLIFFVFVCLYPYYLSWVGATESSWPGGCAIFSFYLSGWI